MQLPCTIFVLYSVICQKSPILTYPAYIWHPCWVEPDTFLPRSLPSEN